MTLPNLVPFNTAEYSFVPKGLDMGNKDEDLLEDSINLEFESGCKSRKARFLGLPFTNEVNQLIKVGDRTFLRFENVIREVVSGENGSLELSNEINLLAYDADKNRQMVEIDNLIYVFPDNLVIDETKGVWQEFGKGCSVSAKFPFVSSTGLYYDRYTLGKEICYESDKLKPGIKLKFSWCPDMEFEVLKKEFAEGMTDVGAINYGHYVWLDKPVPNWNYVSSDATANYSEPICKPMAESFRFGFGNLEYSFSDNAIYLNTAVDSQSRNDSPENYFHKGQKVTIFSSNGSVNNKTAVITGLSSSFIAFDTSFVEECSKPGDMLTLEPVIPTADLAYTDGERLWVADNTDKKLWASMVGKPNLFFINPAEAKDSWYCKLHRKATALFSFKNQIYCFHENGCTKIYGNSALNFSEVSSAISGIPTECEKTVGIIGDSVYYLSGNGLYKYNGSFSKLVTTKIPLSNKLSAVVYQDRYYILSDNRVWVYSSEENRWYCEDGEDTKQIFLCDGKRCYFKSEGIYLSDIGSAPTSWLLTTQNIFESDVIFPLNFKIRANSKSGVDYTVYISQNNGEFKMVTGGYFKGSSVREIILPHSKCNDFKIKILGIGDIIIQNILIKYRRK